LDIAKKKKERIRRERRESRGMKKGEVTWGIGSGKNVGKKTDLYGVWKNGHGWGGGGEELDNV